MKQPSTEDIQIRMLNIDKIFKLEPNNQKIVMDLYQIMLDSLELNKNFSMTSGIDVYSLTTAYNTLVENDFFITRREKNLDILT
jgi:hypothetical protein